MNKEIQQEQALRLTKNWVEHFVVKHNLCPFAVKPLKENRIKYVAHMENDEEALARSLKDEILFLKEAEVSITETSIVVVPLMFGNFVDYNQYLDVVDSILEELNVEGLIQVASFHPEYQFADLSVEDVRNYTNRSPYPMFHLIREESIEAARNKMDTESIPDRNMDLLEGLGIDRVIEELTSIENK